MTVVHLVSACLSLGMAIGVAVSCVLVGAVIDSVVSKLESIGCVKG